MNGMNLTALGEVRRLTDPIDLLGLFAAKTQADTEAWFRTLPLATDCDKKSAADGSEPQAAA